MYWLRMVTGAALLVGVVALQQQLPFCNPESSLHNNLVIVSTLDGRLTAFAADTGKKAWDLQTETLLSSNVHRVELTSNGKWVRLVPSLSGALYRLSADALEPLPVTAEQLLSSTFKYSDDLVIAGSRRTTFMGVEARSGRVVYRCGTGDCHNTDEAGASDVIAVKQTAHTVRALNPRTGHEMWNFSIADHDLGGGDASDCASTDQQKFPDFAVSLILPEGVVAAKKDDLLLWTNQLEAPVADAWTLTAGKLRRVDVLSAAANQQAALYIGVHNQQIYVQESLSFLMRSAKNAQAPLPWRPRPARPLLTGSTISETELQPIDKESAARALSNLYGNTAMSIGNHGYFLAAEPTTCEQGNNVSEEDLIESASSAREDYDGDQELHHVHVHVYSLWMWWKEVVLIAISSALVMNLMIWPKFFAPKFMPQPPVPVNQEFMLVDRRYAVPTPTPAPSFSEYVSRYATDFTPLRCLGRGGFGVVFECRNNIDHCSYAVKRITLPRRESKRARVLREVRALAKLEHENIVRYFNAWLEEPPPAWQRERDAHWLRELDGVSVTMTEEPMTKDAVETQTQTSHSLQTKDKDSVMLNLQKPLWEQLLESQLEKNSQTGKRNRSLSCNDSFSVIFSENTGGKSNMSKVTESHKSKMTEDDSFIVFADSADVNHNSKGSGDAPTNKHLEKVKETESPGHSLKKKKGHRRHWSLDLCVRSSDEAGGPGRPEVYLYIQMQLCRRDSLHTWLRQHRHTHAREQVINIFSQIVSAVEYVHLAGLIHRDLKPSNIFFAPDGKVKVGDFGLVTSMGDNSQDGETAAFEPYTRHTHKVGTHLYMSPEQLRGDPYDFKVDIYSLGLILFELLHPFSTESERVVTLLRLRDGHLPAVFRQKLPQETSLLESMLSASPAERPTANGVRCRAPLTHLAQHASTASQVAS